MAAMDKICPKCGLVNSPTAQVCECGQKLDVPVQVRRNSISALIYAFAGFLIGGTIGFLFFWFDPGPKPILRGCWGTGIFLGGIAGMVVALLMRKAVDLLNRKR